MTVRELKEALSKYDEDLKVQLQYFDEEGDERWENVVDVFVADNSIVLAQYVD